MPSSPELGNIFTSKWKIEILHQPDAHDPCRTYGDIGVSGKIAIDLKSKKDHSNDHGHSMKSRRILINIVDHSSETIRNDHFFK